MQIRNSDCETLTPDTGKSKQEQWSRVETAKVSLKEEKEPVTSGTKLASVRRETSGVSGMRVMIVHQYRHRKPHPPSEPSMTRGRSASRKRSVRGRSQTGRILRQPCRYFLKGTCTRSPCEYWHPPECQFYKTDLGCKAGDKCLFPHFKVGEQPSKMPKNGFQHGKSDDKGAVAFAKTVP